MFKALILLKEKCHQGRLRYMFFNKHSRELAIIFSGIPKDGKAVYNYVRTLRDLPMDQLFLLDDFGVGCSYHWYEDGSLRPKELTQSLIYQVIKRGGV